MPQPEAKAVRRIPLPTRREFFEQWLPLDEPLVIGRAVPNWRAMQEWSIDWLKANHGDAKIWVEDGELFNFRRKNLSVRDFIAQAIEAVPPEKLYWTGARLLNTIPELEEYFDLDRPDLFSQALMSPPIIYVGPDGAFSPLHFDHAPNFAAQIVGRKRWVFYAPTETDLMYRYPWHHILGHFSEINAASKLGDFDAFPLFERAQPYEAMVEPGDLIYIPIGWWHHVTSLGATMSLHFFWKTGPQYARQLALQPLWKALGKRPQSNVRFDWKKIGFVRQALALVGRDNSRQMRELQGLRNGAGAIITGKSRAGEKPGPDVQ